MRLYFYNIDFHINLSYFTISKGKHKFIPPVLVTTNRSRVSIKWDLILKFKDLR